MKARLGRFFSWSTSRSTFISRKGLSVSIKTPKHITMKVGTNKDKRVTTTGLTVGEALIDQKVSLDEQRPGDSLRWVRRSPTALGSS